VSKEDPDDLNTTNTGQTSEAVINLAVSTDCHPDKRCKKLLQPDDRDPKLLQYETAQLWCITLHLKQHWYQRNRCLTTLQKEFNRNPGVTKQKVTTSAQQQEWKPEVTDSF